MCFETNKKNRLKTKFEHCKALVCMDKVVLIRWLLIVGKNLLLNISISYINNSIFFRTIKI